MHEELRWEGGGIKGFHLDPFPSVLNFDMTIIFMSDKFKSKFLKVCVCVKPFYLLTPVVLFKINENGTFSPISSSAFCKGMIAFLYIIR